MPLLVTRRLIPLKVADSPHFARRMEQSLGLYRVSRAPRLERVVVPLSQER